MEKVDTLIKARWVAPVACPGVLEQHAVALRQGRIVDLLPAAEAVARYTADEVLDRPAHLLIPGLVNAHTHAAMTLLRGLADDIPLMQWLQEHIWPAEQRWMSAEFVEHGSELAMAEMLLGGTTTFNDMYFFPEVVARASARIGMRACVGMILIKFPTVWAGDMAEYLRKGLALRDEYKGHPLVSTAFAPHAPYTVDDEYLVKIRRLADELEVPVHTHVHETAEEVMASVVDSGERPFARLDRLGLVSPMLMAVHMTQLEETEIERLAATGASVVHCPESNLKLASGFSPVARLVEAGVNVCLGTDGAASNNDLDMLGEMRTAALLAKGVAGRADAVTAEQVLAMATRNGARALGLGEETGTIEPGKWADLCCVDLGRPGTWPVYDPVAQLVYAASRDQVADVWVAGRRMVAEGRLTRLDPVAIARQAEDWRSRIAGADQHE
ncbi:TRZ/ATZ family hydrolase [Thioalkalivibrio sp. XN8]|uniref:TRZ/ATZ family hydrolase n=1 Tax=Thioalkalivibrio sp. XN8 TaxID=2712863 RepID=UPI0013EAD356|nr:TRZ/ATZ family hydrolase [Thioalkalivibrio sp. XN8]NGP54604.1 TRZ/ATZ family hydrolase [Thioalkalivibrio sp. XN8]